MSRRNRRWLQGYTFQKPCLNSRTGFTNLLSRIRISFYLHAHLDVLQPHRGIYHKNRFLSNKRSETSVMTSYSVYKHHDSAMACQQRVRELLACDEDPLLVNGFEHWSEGISPEVSWRRIFDDSGFLGIHYPSISIARDKVERGFTWLSSHPGQRQFPATKVSSTWSKSERKYYDSVRHPNGLRTQIRKIPTSGACRQHCSLGVD